MDKSVCFFTIHSETKYPQHFIAENDRKAELLNVNRNPLFLQVINSNTFPIQGCFGSLITSHSDLAGKNGTNGTILLPILF